MKRLASAFVALAVVLPAVFFSVLTLQLLVTFTAILCCFELLSMASEGKKEDVWGLWFLLCAFVLALYFSMPNLFLLFMMILIASGALLTFRTPPIQKIPQLLSATFLALGCIVLPLYHFVLLRRFPDGGHWIVWIFAGTFLGDTGAYYAGRAFGRHKLAPKISPGKTWEGFLAQVASAIGGAILWGRFVVPMSPSLQDCAAIGALCGLLGPIGDLTESMLKRGFGVKDSGSIMPGHGGLYDRIDGLLFTAPAVYYYARFVMGV